MTGMIPDVSLVDNSDERSPLVLVLDCSGSMGDDNKMKKLNEALKLLEAELKKDPITAKRCRVLLIGFGGNDDVMSDEWKDAMDFTAPELEANGTTPTGSAVRAALDAIETQKEEMRATGVSYKRPIMMLMSDGDPTDDWEGAAAECRAAEAAHKVTVMAIAIGDDANIDILGQFSSKGAKRLAGLKFKEMFVWLSRSVRAVSQAVKGEAAQIPATDGWAAPIETSN